MAREIVNVKDAPHPTRHFSQAVKCHPFVFVSGQTAIDSEGKIAGEAKPKVPYMNASQAEMRLQTAFVCRNMQKILESAGSSLDNLVRVERYILQKTDANPHLEEYMKHVSRYRPASSLLEVSRLQAPGALVQIDPIGFIPDCGKKEVLGEVAEIEKIEDTALFATHEMPYSTIVKAGGFLFLAGHIASDNVTGLAPEARVKEYSWWGSEIKRQTEYILKKLQEYMRYGGSSFENVVYATVHLTDFTDLLEFDDVFKQYFPSKPPARTCIHIKSLGTGLRWIDPGKGQRELATRNEITITAFLDNSDLKKEVISTDVGTLPNQSVAIKAGQFLFVSNLYPGDEDGLSREVLVDSSYAPPCLAVKRQARHILRDMDLICRAAGTKLNDVLRLQVFLTSMDKVDGFFEALEEFFPRDPPAVSCVGIPSISGMPGAEVTMNAIACIP
jgi:enamine deaminase RidA (YjgF/YER057c/UK114 family)